MGWGVGTDGCGEAIIGWIDSRIANGTIKAAGLDVFANEPNVPQDLIKLPNVVLFPHVGSATTETRMAMGNLAYDNLIAHFAGKPVLTRVI